MLPDEGSSALNHEALRALRVALDNAGTGGSILCRPSIQSARCDLAEAQRNGIRSERRDIASIIRQQ